MNITVSLDAILRLLHSLHLSTSNKQWLADHLYDEVRAERQGAIKPRKKLTEKEKDALFEQMVGSIKDTPIGDEVLEAIRIGRQRPDYERKLAYLEEDE